ncbi:YihY/virulence factor BrkB family protein [Solicola sp. PLA-1-18]|uniref:YihY/virulence factor BrkB family protein n=1 Tax=Solicola sp. PLA-1-18 TaxID=3380532 RepID=UPI003B7FE8EC
MTEEKQGIGAKIAARLEAARARSPFLDHVLRMNDHYTRSGGNLLAGGVTYFGFLSFFPLLAMAFAVAGWVSNIYPQANDTVVTAVQGILPGIISDQPGDGSITLDQITQAAATVGVVALVGLLYTGLGWIQALRESVTTTFDQSIAKRPNFVVGKATDLLALVVIGLILTVSVSITSLVGGFTDAILDVVQTPGVVAQVVVYVLGALVGLAASTLLFFAIFSILGRGSHVPASARRSGALLSAIGFEVLKFLVVYVLGSVGGTAFAPLALAITLVVWINYCSRLTVYGAAWAYTVRGVAALDTAPAAEPYALGHEPESTIRVEPAAAAMPSASQLVTLARPVAVLGSLVALLYAWLRSEKAKELTRR